MQSCGYAKCAIGTARGVIVDFCCRIAANSGYLIARSGQVAYNEVVNVFMTVPGSASEMNGSECFKNKQLFPEYRPMGLSRYLENFELNNRQELFKLSQFCMNSRASNGIMKRQFR